MKHILVTPDTHQLLMYIKTEQKAKNIEDVIQYLLKLDIEYGQTSKR